MGLLAIEYRGYASSTGSPSERGPQARRGSGLCGGDRERRRARSASCLSGSRLGSGVAVALAARHKIGALVLDSPYSSIVDVAAARPTGSCPVRALLRDPFRNDLLIGSVHRADLIVHGTKDPVVPIRFGEKLFALANAPKAFWRVEGAAHLAMGRALRRNSVLDRPDRRVTSTAGSGAPWRNPGIAAKTGLKRRRRLARPVRSPRERAHEECPGPDSARQRSL